MPSRTYSASVDGAYEIADADRKTFYTKAGRPVKDGGGEQFNCITVPVLLLNNERNQA